MIYLKECGQSFHYRFLVVSREKLKCWWLLYALLILQSRAISSCSEIIEHLLLNKIHSFTPEEFQKLSLDRNVYFLC